MNYTIDDLTNGKCAVINDGTLEELQKVLKLAFPIDRSPVEGCDKYYFALDNKGIWTSVFEHINLPTQSVKDFLKKENMQTNVSNNSDDLFNIYSVKLPTEISRRDYFTAMAMQGILASGERLSNLNDYSLRIADALIAELDKPRK